MAGSFKTPCPSCEADVLVKGSNLIGKKIDCTKCKYRFTVPDPAGDTDDGFDVVEKPKKKGNPKALVGIILGVVGVAVLVGGGIMMLGGDKTPPAKVSGGPSPRPVTPPPTNDEKKDESKKDESKKDETKKDETKKETPLTPPIFNPGAGTEATKPKETPKPAEDLRPVDPSKLKDPSNLLPNETEAAMKINFDRLRLTPAYDPFFDKSMKDFFQSAMGFESSDLESAHFCLVTAVREPFAVLRTKRPVSLNELQRRSGDDLQAMTPINQRIPFLIKSNAFIQALARVVSAESLRNDAGVPISEEEKKRWSENKAMGLHFYDSQTILIGDMATLQRYLMDLKNGEPPHLTEALPGAPAAAPAAGGTTTAPAAPTKVGEAPPPVTTAPATTTPAAETDPKLFAAKPNYLTIKPDLKAMFNRIEADEKDLPTIAYVDRCNQRSFDFASERDLNTNDVIFLILRQFLPTVEIMGLSVNTLNKDKFTARMVFKYLSDTDREESIEKKIKPFFGQIWRQMEFFFGSTIEDGSTLGTPNGGARGAGDTPMGADDPGGFAGTKSKITLTSLDLTAMLEFDINISSNRYKNAILPQLMDIITQMKGRMMVLSGDTTWHSLSSRFSKMLAEKKTTPLGVLPRDSKPDRFGLPYPPDYRASFIVELLPYLGRGQLRDSIQEKKYAWFAKENLRAAQTWVPELLVPYYPQTSWRAFHPLAEGGTAPLGATNFVGLAGIGRDAARYDPTDAAQAKLVGMTGYNWGSKPSDVTDGMSNTIYMIQVPPGHNRPWITGGGATVMGVAADGNPISDFVSVEGGKRGTYALMADGSVRFLPDTIDAKTFRAMVTRAGGEDIGEDVKKLPLVPVPKNLETELKGGKSTADAKKPTRTFGKVDDEELKKLQGKWRVTAMFLNGSNLSGEDLAEQNRTITIEGTAMTIEVSGNSATVTIKHLDPKAKPAQISFQNPEEAKESKITAGVYSYDGKKLKMRYIKNTTGDNRPSEVKNPGAGADPQESYLELVKAE